MRRAVFLDRDGTLIADRGDLKDPADIELLPGTVKTLREIQERFVLFVITHQPAVAAGRLTMEEVTRVNDALVDRLRAEGVTIERVFVCPHARGEGCECIKPKPYFLHQVQRQYGIDLGESFTVGDHPHDAELATSVGATGIYVLTGHGRKHLGELGPGFVVVPSLADARPALLDTGPERDSDPVDSAARRLRSGRVVAFPTETVYGLGANALDPKAVARIFAIKNRPTFDPLIVHIADMSWLERIAQSVPERARRLVRVFWPGPLTVVLCKTSIIPDLVTAGLPSVAVRMPGHETALALIRKSAIPVCAPSANPFGYVSPTRAEHVIEQLGSNVDCVIDGGPCPVGIESTIVDVGGSVPRVLRLGAVTLEDLREVLGEDLVVETSGTTPAAPGMLPGHYAPRVRLTVFDGEIPRAPTPASGLVLQRPREAPAGYAAVEILSRDGDPAEAAHNLFAVLRGLDRAGLDSLVAELAPERGIGRAINDRLRRASFRGGSSEGQRSSSG